ncbi:NTF2-like N-terminal transpeptidase domain-containing protein [Streptomyces sp. cf386]|uniref:penicillin-binding transpeptidase domain-containing protein n=1 Tax=Streptomyces sp. cf386 TaxID=1761904 RepID=UPI00089140E7|nr:penicillin-binding transpeptidase domain-containing protein [Streptomyces sp. cf386]SDM79879.1 NTF2-like N-terminal transpeptidase domain-containing protein [Streptomyces sp. cf386]
MSKGVKVAVIGGVFAVMVGGAGYGAYNIMSALNGGGATGAAGPAPVQSGPPSADEVEETTKKFFAAWEKGQAAQAAAFTNNDTAAERVLTSYGEGAHITGVKITPGSASGATVPFSVKAKVSYGGKSKALDYRSELTVVRGLTTGKALVDWEPTVIHPELKRDDTLVTGEAASPPIEAVDRNGTVLTKEKYPSLGPILDSLRDKYGDKAGGEAGVELAIRHADESPDTSLLTLAKGKPGKLETTLSASVQAAAEKAVKQYAQSSVVALKPSTGEVLAVANHRDDAWNAAFEGKVAPGSTMKIITAAMLIDNGVTSMNGPAPCPPTAMWQSQTFKNLTGLEPDESANATLANGFMRSCNTAFIKLVDEDPLTDASLTAEAEERFGLGRDWKTGITSFDGSVPASTGPDRAANAIGQGQVQMNPLNMASVTATAITGRFRQPYLVARDLDDRPFATADGLRASTAAQLKQMMRLTATASQGTAVQAMSGLGGDIGAKTGSAEVDGKATSDSWFTGFRDDVAAAAMSQQGGHGGDAAGPIVAAVLRASG